jgi:hypothetical protein
MIFHGPHANHIHKKKHYVNVQTPLFCGYNVMYYDDEWWKKASCLDQIYGTHGNQVD